MNLSSLVHTGIITRPQRGLIFGSKGVGKTKAVASLENTLLIDTEAGSHQYPCARITVGNYQELDTAIKTLLTETNDYQLIAIDTIDWADEYLRAEVCREQGVHDIGELAHGRGYVLWRDKFIDFLLKLNGFIRLQKHVVLIGHSQIRTVSLPALDPFDRFELKLDKRNIEATTEWVDFQLFLNWDIRTVKTKEGTIRARGGNDRFIYSVNDLAYDAKNRLGIVEPLKLEPASLRQFLGNFPVPATATVVTETTAATKTTAEQSIAATEKPTTVKPAATPAAKAAAAQPAATKPAVTKPAAAETPLEPSAQERLQKALSIVHQDWVTDFLIDRQKIVAGQSVLDAPSEYCEKALSRINEFRNAIIAFGKARDGVSVSIDT